MSNYAWLCEYDNSAVANTYGIVIQTDDFDRSEILSLQDKKKCNVIGDKERLEILEKINRDFDRAWHDRNRLENLPIKLFKKIDINYSNMPNEDDIMFVITNGYLILSKNLYNVISQFNLGKTHFSQVYIYDIETKEQLSDVPYYFVNIAEKFEFLDFESSQEISINEYFPQQRKRWIREPKDDDIVLLLQAKDNMIDLWHDPLLNNSLFFSDRLVTALLNAGFSKQQLGLIRCVIQ